MKPIEPSELSGYLDGELEPDRVLEVEAALANDPTLRADYQALANADSAWKSAAHSAAFAPNTQLPISKSWTGSPFAVAAILVLLVALRIAPKLADVVELGLILHAAALAVMIPWVVHMAREGRS
jgi:anti-sigma factor RsiW